MHPIFAHRERLWLYLGAWIPGSGFLVALVSSSSGMPWQQATALALPLGMLYAFVCLAAWYPCQAMPLAGGNLIQPIAAHSLAAAISSSIWLVAGLGCAMLLDRIPEYEGTSEHFRGMLILFFSVGLLLYALAVVVNYLLIAFEASRETESRNLELEVQARDAELRAIRARREQELAENELELARSIQRRLLPPAEMRGTGYQVSSRNLPARFVAGDFYDVFALAGGKIGLVVADVAGKGIGASLITASVKAMTPLIAERHSVTETLDRLNDKLCAELTSREFVALSLALYDPFAGTLELANSGLPDPYLLRPGFEPEMISVPGPRLPLGIRPGIRYESCKVQLAVGERLLLLTDGMPEALTAPDEPLGYDRLTSLLGDNGATATPGDWLDGVLERVRSATNGASEDDLTAVVLQRM